MNKCLSCLLLFIILLSAFSANADVYNDDRGRYLIIVHDMFYNSVLPLADWKHQKGMEVDVRKISEVGPSSSDIENFIDNAYYNWEVPPEYVLLVGDTEFLPTSGSSSDSYYADVEGDFHEDLYIGRFPTDTMTEAETMVQKALNYERYPYVEDDSWFTSACLIANDNDYSPDEYIDDTAYIDSLMTQGGYDNVEDLYWSEGDNSGTVINLINNGVTFVNYRGQGGSNWASPFGMNPDQTSPGWKLPVVISGTCITGAIDWDGAVGEEWLRAGTPENPKGGVAFYGAETSGNGFITNLRGAVSRGFFNSIFLNDNNILGKAAVHAKDHMISMYPNEVSEYRGWILQGDPELNMYTAVPQEISVEYPIVIPAGATAMPVTCTVNGEPVEDVLVCFHAEDVMYSWAYSDEDGIAMLEFDPVPPLPGEQITVTATGKNLLPYEGSMEIVTGEAFEGYVTDVNTGDPLRAKVFLDSYPIYTFADEETGFYRLFVPSSGNYVMHAEYWGYEPYVSESFTIAEEETLTVDIQMINAENTGAIEGYVIDSRGNALSGVKLKVLNADRGPEFTDATGYFRFDAMTSDYEYLIQASLNYYDSYTKTVFVYEGEMVELNFKLADIEEFEDDDADFSGEHDWEWGIPADVGGPEAAYDGQRVWGTNLDGFYEVNVNQSLYSPEFYLGPYEDNYMMRMGIWYQTEDGWDGGNIQVSTDEGETWEVVIPEENYPDNSVVGLTGQPGFTGDSDGWQIYNFDLSNYAGEFINIRVRFASTNATDKGLFIDHFVLYGTALTTDVDEDSPFTTATPKKAALHQNYPNPFNPKTAINFDLPEKQHIDLKIYDVSGKLVRTLVSGEEDAGYHSIVWDGKDDTGNAVNSGVYIYRIDAENYRETKRMILLK